MRLLLRVGVTDTEDSLIQWARDMMSIEARQQREVVRSFAFLLSICLCIAGYCGLVCRGTCGDDTRSILLSGRLNPNEASAASLMRLPGVGAVRAFAIVAYREQAGTLEGGRRAFTNCDDLQKIKGIGPKTAEKLRKYLEFD